MISLNKEPKAWKLITGQTAELEPIQIETSRQNLDEVSQELPNGAYTTFRTFDRSEVLHLEQHLTRLEETAALAGSPIHLDHEQIRAGLRQAVQTFSNGDVRARITLDLSNRPGSLYISLENLQVPSPEQYRNGVRTALQPLHRENPKAKLTSFISAASKIRKKMAQGVYETLMVGNDGTILEGLSSNFFGIRNGEIWTAEAGVLPGITRSIVLEVTRANAFPIHLQGYPAKEIALLEEAFISSSTRGVLPVVQIDDVIIKNGKPGPLTRRISEAYQQQIGKELETI